MYNVLKTLFFLLQATFIFSYVAKDTLFLIENSTVTVSVLIKIPNFNKDYKGLSQHFVWFLVLVGHVLNFHLYFIKPKVKISLTE